jgi:hypothetical protein
MGRWSQSIAALYPAIADRTAARNLVVNANLFAKLLCARGVEK